MPASPRVRATFDDVQPAERSEHVGVELEFRLERRGLGVESIRNFAALGPSYCLPAVEGLGKVLRILRAARIAAPSDTSSLLEHVPEAARLLERAVGTRMVLELRPRSRLRFLAWTEERVEVIENVREVVETPDSYLISLHRGHYPIRIPRSEVVRQVTETERWFEILSIERA